MKKQIRLLPMTLLATFITLAVGMTHAQYTTQAIRAVIPFTFNIGTQQFPPGEYNLSPARASRETILISNQKGPLIFVWTGAVEPRTSSDSPRLVFNRYGAQYFLEQIWEFDGAGRQLDKSRAEIQMGKLQSSPPEQVAVALAPHF